MRAEMRQIKDLVRETYKNTKGEPFDLTDGQAEIFSLIFKRKYPRNQIQTHTRYGKSDVISMAVLLRASTFPEKWAIVAGNKDKARIIMQYAIGHIFDNPAIAKKFVMDPGDTEELIRRYRNKDRINFKLDNGLLGEIFITTAEGALGFGAPNIVEDESALISENDHALVMRMLGDQPENFLCKVGNPWTSEHFIKSFEDENYHKLIIDFSQGIREGRLTPAYVDEMKKQPFFDVLYECKFPKSGLADEKGWVQLFTRDEVERAMVDLVEGFGVKKLGVDVAGGGRNFSVIVKRHTNIARVLLRNQNPDTMSLAEVVISLINKKEQWKYDIQPADVSIDKVGIGKGVYDIVNRQCPGVYGVSGAEEPTTPQDKEKFLNLRAELFWKAREWILGGGKLERNDGWYELTKIKYRTKLQGTKGKMQIISKEEMLKEGTISPDVADAFVMTFRSPDIVPLDPEELEMQRNKEDAFNPFDPFG